MLLCNISCKDTSLGITLIGKTGQDSCENSRCKWKHRSTRKLDKFLNPGYGCELDQTTAYSLDVSQFINHRTI